MDHEVDEVDSDGNYIFIIHKSQVCQYTIVYKEIFIKHLALNTLYIQGVPQKLTFIVFEAVPL